MSLGNPESNISHENFLGYCPLCKDRGINNWTELHGFGNIVCCGSCKSFLKGELEQDIPELKLYRKDMGKTPKQEQAKVVNIAPQTQFIPQESPIIPNSEVAEHAQWLSSHPDQKLRKEVAESILSDPDSLFRILADPRFFSLKELRKHAERLKKPDITVPFEEMALKKHPGRPPENPVIAEERRKASHARSKLKLYHKKKKEKLCQSNQNQDISKTTKISPSSMEKEPLNREEAISPSSQTLREKARDQVTVSKAKAHLNDSRNSDTNHTGASNE